MRAGIYKTFRLRHGLRIRSFSNVTVRAIEAAAGPMVEFPVPWRPGEVHRAPSIETRWELTGIEHKTEVRATGEPGAFAEYVVDIPVTVGFLPENVIE